MLYWNWHSIHNDYEAYWMGLLGHDLEENEAFREACLIGEEWKKIGKRLSPLSKENRVVLVVDNVSMDALKWYPDRKPHGLTDCFGMMYQQFTEPGTMTVRGKAVRYFSELLQAKSAEVLDVYEHRYWGKYAAATRNGYGLGYAYYIGTYVEKEQLKEYILKAAAAAEMEMPACQWPVIMRSGVASGKRLYYILHYSEECREIECPYEKAEELFSGKIYCRGEKIALKDWDVKILEEMM